MYQSIKYVLFGFAKRTGSFGPIRRSTKCHSIDWLFSNDYLAVLVDENEIVHTDLREVLGERVQPYNNQRCL